MNDSRLHLTRGNHIVGEIKRVSSEFQPLNEIKPVDVHFLSRYGLKG